MPRWNGDSDQRPGNLLRIQLKSISPNASLQSHLFVSLRGTLKSFAHTTSISRFPVPVSDFAIEWRLDCFRQAQKCARILVDASLPRAARWITSTRFKSQSTFTANHSRRFCRNVGFFALCLVCFIGRDSTPGPAATNCIFVISDSPCWPVGRLVYAQD